MENELNNQELSNERIKELLKEHNLTPRHIALKWGKRPQQLYTAINTNEQPGLRRRLVRKLLRLESKMQTVTENQI